MRISIPGRQRLLRYRWGKKPFDAITPGGVEQYTGLVAASANDAYETVATGAMDLTSSPVLMGGWTGVAEVYTAGFRFTNIDISQGAEVPFAQVRFVAGAGNGDTCLLRIYAEDTDNSSAFTSTSGNLTSRTKTTAYVDWNVPVWETLLNSADTISPDISSVIKEVIDRPGWVSGNSISLIIETSPLDGGTGFPRRRPIAYDGTPANAAELYINTTESGGTPDPTPTGSFSDGYDTYGLEGNASFNPASPTLKDGTAFTAAMSTYYDAFMYGFLSESADSYVRVSSVFASNDIYEQARRAQFTQEAATIAFRLTGDLRILDRLCYGYNLMNANMYQGWTSFNNAALDARSIQWGTAGVTRSGRVMTGNPYATNRSLKFLLGSSSADYRYRTDIHHFNEGKSRSLMATFAWALHLNRAKTSPGGYDYNALADLWAGVLGGTDGAHDSWWYAWSGNSTADWALQNYRGVDVASGLPWPTGRTAPGSWPVYFSTEGHATYNGLYLNRYLGLLGQHGNQGGVALDILNPANAAAACDQYADVQASYWVASLDSYSRPSIIPRGSLGGSRNGEPLMATYSAYAGHSFIELWMSGAFPAVHNTENMLRLARSYADMVYTSGATDNVVGGSVDYGSHGLDLTVGSEQSSLSNAQKGMSSMLVFADEAETGGGRLFASATAAQNANGGYATPTRFVLPAAQFAKRALDAIGAFA